MKKSNINSKEGFTIIEVILVLAIGSLIILMALVALPSLQSSQRDQQRKSDYSMLQTAITNYASAHKYNLPDDNDFWEEYIKDSWGDPTKGEYTVIIETADQPIDRDLADRENDHTGEIYIIKNAKCDGDKPVYDKKLGKRSYAIHAYLESGQYCQSSN